MGESETRLKFGELAVLRELITREQLEESLEDQAQRRRREDRTAKLGTLLVRQGLLTKQEAKRLLKFQRQGGPIDGYRLVDHLGTGGMGSVYRAINESDGRMVAVKILTLSASRNARFRARFLREAEVSNKLRHPNLVRSEHQGESNGHLFFAMEYVPGCNARDVLRRKGPLGEDTTRDYFRQILLGMTHYWESRVVHRDIKPENILVAPDGTVKLTDLGLCRELDDEAHLTRAGKTLGTPLYISPELAKGFSDIDVRSDLYSLGATFFHLATGVPPFQSSSAAELLRMHVEDDPVPARLKNPRLSAGLEVIFARLLEKDPDDRPKTPEEVIEALERLEAGSAPFEVLSASSVADPVPAEAQPETPAPKPAAPAARKRYGSSGKQVAVGRRPGSSSSASIFPGIGPKKRSVLAPLLSVVGFAALFLLGLFLGARAKTPAAASVPEAGSQDPRAAFLELVESDSRAALEEAQSYARRHPDDHDGQIFRFEALRGRLDPGVAEQVDRQLEDARKDLEDAGFEEVEALRTELIELVEQGRMTEARSRLADFPSRYEGTPAWDTYLELKAELEHHD